MRVLIADDDRGTAQALGGTLKRWGFDVAIAHDGEEAWKLLQADTEFGLAILDWMMPGLDGLEICRRVRQDESRQGMYLLLLTARDSRADLVTGLDAGADDYLSKPFDPDELRARVQVGLRVLTLQTRLAERIAALQTALASVKRLSGLLPICSYCKCVRRDQDYWEQVEQYVTQHSEVTFSHAICPSCFEKMSADLDDLAGAQAAGRTTR